MMKHYGMIARSLIALLFVVAGVQKAMDFTNTTMGIQSLGLPAAALVTALVIFVEVVVAALFAWGYKVKETGWTLVAFTALATLLVHRDIGVGMNMVMALKNIAIIGGIMLAIKCGDKNHA